MLPPDFIADFRKRFTGDLRLDPASRVLYSTDASMYQIEPFGVAFPKHQEDLHAAVELAAQYKVPILPRGSGSSLGGQAIGEALILDCSRHLTSILEINPEARTATVEPGVILAALNRAASQHGLMFGPDPASAERATMGGVIGNNATGAHSILYGMTADHLLAADVILADGSRVSWNSHQSSVISDQSVGERQAEIIRVIQEIRENYAEAIKQNYPKTWRNSAGYRLNYLLPWSPSKPPQWLGDYPPLYPFDAAQGKPSSLTSHLSSLNPSSLAPFIIHHSSFIIPPSLLAGSEGTLAILARATLNLVPKPKHTILGLLAYDRIPAACDDVLRLLEFHPSAIELVPRMILRLARGVPAYARQMGWVVGDPAAILVVEFSGDDPAALKSQARKIGEVLTIAETPEEQARVWGVRKVGLGILDSRPTSARPAAFIEDCAIPVERLGEFIREIERILAGHNAEGGIYAHASAGCLHIRPILDLHTGEGRRALRTIGEQVFALASRLGGSMSSEHGDGIVSGEWIERTYGPAVTEAMRRLKRAADPDNLLNPGKLFDAPPMDSHLRFSEDYRPETWTSILRFDHERGLAGAIEQCNGQGVCRKDMGMMCPSFQATREESLSTRGRANLLRAIVSQPVSRATPHAKRAAQPLSSNAYLLSPNSLTASTFASLDLCLACKGCTSECPSGVDMPRLKSEFMNEYYKSHRRPIHDYLFGYFHVVAKILSPIAPLANLFMRMDWSRRLIARLTGIAEERPFPVFASKRRQVDRYTGKQVGRRGKVLFMTDVFLRYIEPEVEQAALDLLGAAGYEMETLPVIGAGASFLSKGFLAAARRHAESVLDAIQAIGGDSVAGIVGCEPPEIYCLKNEYLALLPERRAEIESVASRTWMAEEFLVRSGALDDLRVAKIKRHNGAADRPAEHNSIRLSASPQASVPESVHPFPSVDNLRESVIESVNQIRSSVPHPLTNSVDRLTFHPHCHQRAEPPADDGFPSGPEATVALLRAAGFEVDVTDGGCCGMAGTFGYDAAHYELSMQIGELNVLPRLRAARQVTATGAACRLQIKQGAAKDASHPLVLARDRLLGV
jgi:FAD/FMN-containing dehydrogenase/Fe-S oxidoreductase